MDWAVAKAMSRLPQADRMPGLGALHEVSISARRRWKEDAENLKDGTDYRPKTLDAIASQLDQCEQIKACQYEDGAYGIHIVERGDSLRKISKELYGDAEKWRIIFEANSYKIDNPDRIYVGMSLVIPKTVNLFRV